MRILFNKIQELFRSERGAATVEFVLVFPFFVGVFLSAFDVAMMNFRAVMLERATDIAVREIRLSSGAQLNYDQVKADICAETFMISDCTNAIMVELQAVDTDAAVWNSMANQTQCVDRSAVIQPLVQFQNGQQNELMLMRVCAVVDPMFPGIGVGRTMPKDPSGGYQVIATSAFVNEPI